MAMKFLTDIKYLMDYSLQVREYKYSVPGLSNQLWCDGV